MELNSLLIFFFEHSVPFYSRKHKDQLGLCKIKYGKPRDNTGLRVISDTVITATGYDSSLILVVLRKIRLFSMARAHTTN